MMVVIAVAINLQDGFLTFSPTKRMDPLNMQLLLNLKKFLKREPKMSLTFTAER